MKLKHQWITRSERKILSRTTELDVIAFYFTADADIVVQLVLLSPENTEIGTSVLQAKMSLLFGTDGHKRRRDLIDCLLIQGYPNAVINLFILGIYKLYPIYHSIHENNQC